MGLSYTLNDLLRIKKHQVEMMFDRGFDISTSEQWLLKTDELDQTNILNYFKQYYDQLAQHMNQSFRESMSQVYYSGRNKTIVKFLDTIEGATTVSTDLIKDTISLLLNPGFLSSINIDMLHDNIGLIIVSELPLSAPALKKIQTEFSAYQIEIFFYSMLAINPSKHMLANEHVKLTRAEVQGLIKTYNLQLTDLRVLLDDDMMVRYYGGQAGDVFKICRKAEHIGVIDQANISYALVISHAKLRAKKTKMSDMQKGK